jgi:hypothetical protein
MSKVFYDKLIVLTDVEREVNSLSRTKEEKNELWEIIDDTVHQRVLSCLFENLPESSHQEFIDKFDLCPFDEGLFDYLTGKIGKNVEELIKNELGELAYEILQDLKGEGFKGKK